MSGAPGARWGFHRLTETAAARLAAEAGIVAGDLVVDIGAGTGAITSALVARGARVIAIELHPGRAAALRRAFASENVVVVQTDARDLRLPRAPFKVVANPPFASSAAILRRLVAPGSRLERADLVLPWYVARRWSGPQAPGLGRWGETFDADMRRTIPRHTLHPPPPGDVAVLMIERRQARSRPPGVSRQR